jgi:hypothetical protein
MNAFKSFWHLHLIPHLKITVRFKVAATIWRPLKVSSSGLSILVSRVVETWVEGYPRAAFRQSSRQQRATSHETFDFSHALTDPMAN